MYGMTLLLLNRRLPPLRAAATWTQSWLLKNSRASSLSSRMKARRSNRLQQLLSSPMRCRLRKLAPDPCPLPSLFSFLCLCLSGLRTCLFLLLTSQTHQLSMIPGIMMVLDHTLPPPLHHHHPRFLPFLFLPPPPLLLGRRRLLRLLSASFLLFHFLRSPRPFPPT